MSTALNANMNAAIQAKGLNGATITNPGMVWFDATVVTRREVAGTVHLEIDVPHEVKASFDHPGQYLHLKVGEVHGPFAPATAPKGHGPLEVLFKPGTPLTDLLEKIPAGATLQASTASGAGFPLEAAKGRPLLLIASGTGQAPMRSVIDSVRRHRAEYGPVTLLLGLRDIEHLAFPGDEAAWQAEGVDVHLTLSRGGDGWKGRTGRVQLHLPHGDLSRTIAFVVGQRAMVAEVVDELVKRGMPREQIFLNV
jgi:NAD(P)H-flavin reductase